MMDFDIIMNAVLDISTPVIKESIFRTKFLPLVFSEDAGAFDRAWLHQIAGNPHTEVNVVSDTDPKKVYFTVPPLREHIDKMVPKEINAIIDYIQQESAASLHPETFIETNMVNVIPIAMGVPKENDEIWRNVILKFYNLAPKETSVTDNTVGDMNVMLSDQFDDD